MRWGLFVCVLLVACVSPSLVPCGDLSCPSGSVCYEGNRCASPEQLQACELLSDGAPCTADAVAGTCAGGLCVSGRCGNSIVELGEVCDDGNRISGDGCREDCLSNESCGNGLLDLGESCDCGSSAATKPGYCTSTNDEALTAECNTTCTRRCGDGVVTGSEQCDGSMVPLGCRDFGFYAGETSCTPACTLDRSRCAGRCGDGIVQAIDGEQCDGSPPAERSCVSYGFDAGEVTCNDLCAPDLANSCEQYDWEVMLQVPPDDFILDASANARAVVGVRYSDGAVTGLWDGAAFTHGAAYRFAVAADGFVGAATDSILSRFDGATWTDTSLSAPPIAIEATRQGTVYALHADCSIQRIAAVSDSLPAPGSQCIAMKVYADNEIYVSGPGAQLWKWDGTTWTAPDYTGTEDVFYIAKRGDTLVTAYGLPYELGASEPLIDRSVYGMASSGNVLVVATEEFPAIIPATQWMHMRFVNDDPDYGLVPYVRNTPDGQVLGWGNGIFRLHTTWVSLSAPVEYGFQARINVSPDGHVYTGARYPYDATLSSALPDTGDFAYALLASRTQLVEVGSAGLSHLESDGFYSDGVPNPIDGFVDAATNDDVYVLTVDDVVRREADGTLTWLDAPGGCAWQMISAVDAAAIYIAGDCGGTQRIYRRQTGTWTEVASPSPVPMESMYVAPDGQIFGTYENDPFFGAAVHWDGTSWEQWPYYGYDVAGLSATDVYFVGGVNDHGVPVLHHWNGTAVESVRLPDGASGQYAIAAGAGQIAVFRDGRADVLVPIK